MAEEKEAKAPSMPDVEFTEPKAGLHNFYANYSGFTWSGYDLRIKFGELVSIADPQSSDPQRRKPIIEERVAITMPWAQAKILRDMLARVVAGYEIVNGEIKVLGAPASNQNSPQASEQVQ